jgi:hypothetical protein
MRLTPSKSDGSKVMLPDPLLRTHAQNGIHTLKLVDLAFHYIIYTSRGNGIVAMV